MQQNQKNQQQYTIDYSADLAEQISQNMALSAQIALNMLPILEPPRIATILKDTGLPPTCLELTESILMREPADPRQP